MGVLLIITGFIMIVLGVSVILKKKLINRSEFPEKKEEQKLRLPNSKEESMKINKAKGDAFEKYIVKKFNQTSFTITEWRSDKYTDGIYAISNHFPDLEIIFESKNENIKSKFAVECKWRNNYFKNEIQWAEDYQIVNYHAYAKKLNIPVIVIIGVGGKPSEPAALFLIPLHSLKSNSISKEELYQYRKEDLAGRFFWSHSKMELN